MAEWLYEGGIGEARAALVEDGAIVAAAIELPGLREGTVAPARLIERATGRVRLDSGDEARLAGAAGVPEGGALTARITREAIAEPGGRLKPARAVATDEPPRLGMDLRARLDGAPVRVVTANGPDALEAAGWSEVLEAVRTGEIAFPGGALRLWVTPAMTLFDVDGGGPPEALAVRAAAAVGAAVRRLGVGGSVGVDFPTLAGKGPRQAVAAALDASLPRPFERTAMNGFGFVQIVMPRRRASLPELLLADPVGAAGRAALRRLEREPPGGPAPHRLSAAVLAWLEARPALLAELARRTGATPRLERA